MLREPLPKLLLIGDRFTISEISSRIAEAVACGVPWIQLRDHEAEVTDFILAATSLVDRVRGIRPDVLVSINTHVGVAEKLACALHVGKRGPTIEEVRSLVPSGLPVGTSAHRLEEVQPGRADYMIWSPVFDTTSKPGQPGTGLEDLSQACLQAKYMPVIAMGGVTPDRARACMNEGAHGVAILSGILEAPDIRSTVNQYLEIVDPER